MTGRDLTSFPVEYAAQVNSRPSIPCSTIRAGPSEKANLIASGKSSGFLTFVIPKLEPQSVGLTNTGNFSFPATFFVTASMSIPFRTNTSGAHFTKSSSRK